MSKDLILKKLEQMKKLLAELDSLLKLPFAEFRKAFTNIRSAERNFQLLIELASDINTHLVIESGKETPDTYRESFTQMAELEILKKQDLKDYLKSSSLRNILIHEYDNVSFSFFSKSVVM